MSTRYDITLPNGKKLPVFWEAEQSKIEIVRDMLQPRWEQYCLEHWLGSGERSVSETNIKRFLDGCAYILLRDTPGDTLTDYKEIMIGSKELNVSSCPAYIADVVDGGGATLAMGDEDEGMRFACLLEALDAKAEKYQKKSVVKKKQRPSTRFDRLEQIRKNYPNCLISCPQPVDTLGVFVYNGVSYQIDSGCAKYAPHITREGEQYDMDRITVVKLKDGEQLFFDHDIYPLEPNQVHML